jgi:hypothetical protein
MEKVDDQKMKKGRKALSLEQAWEKLAWKAKEQY